jgi:hypothetical protein
MMHLDLVYDRLGPAAALGAALRRRGVNWQSSARSIVLSTTGPRLMLIYFADTVDRGSLSNFLQWSEQERCP